MTHLNKRILSLALALGLFLSLFVMPMGAADKSEMPGYQAGTPDDPNTPESIGTIALSLDLTGSGSGYTATYTASTTMLDWLARAATICKDDPRMEKLRFTCTLSDALTARLSGVTGDDYSFTSAKYDDKDIFVPDEPGAVTLSGGALKLRYRLNPDVLSAWRYDLAVQVKEALQQPMTMTAAKGIPAYELASLDSFIYTTARVDITMTEGRIPFYDEPDILAARGACYADNPEYIYDEPTQTISVKDETPSVEPGQQPESNLPVPGGKTTVDKPAAKPNEEVTITTRPDQGSMINYIVIKDINGQRIPLTYDGNGQFTFTMPENGSVSIDAVYRVIPADPVETGVAEALNTDDHIIYLKGDTKGNFRPDDDIKRSEVAMAFYRLLLDQTIARVLHFEDVNETDWYVEPIEVLASLGILKGVGNGNYEPERAITRAEFAAIAVRFTEKRFPGVSFSDVPEDAWYAEAVSTAAHFGWITGMGNGTFEPNRPITRTEAAAIINRMLQRTGDWIDIDAGEGRHYPDVDEDFWGRYDIIEASSDHSYLQEHQFYYENWKSKDAHDAEH